MLHQTGSYYFGNVYICVLIPWERCYAYCTIEDWLQGIYMNKQETFNKLRDHLLSQNCKAMNGPQCRYRTANGKMCAAGPFIPDSLYRLKMEGNSIANVVREYDPDQLQIKGDMGIISGGQQIHDCYPVNSWEEQLRKLADKFGLEY